MELKLKFFQLFTFVQILNHSPAQDLSNKKNRSFLRLLWAQIFLLQFIKFWPGFDTNALYFVRPLYMYSTCIWTVKRQAKTVQRL